MTTLHRLVVWFVSAGVLLPVIALATPFVDVEGRIDEVYAERTSSLIGKPGRYWVRMSDGDTWIFIPSDTNAGLAAGAAATTMNTLGSEFFWKVPGGVNVGSVYFTLNADPKMPDGEGLARDYNKLRTLTMHHTEDPQMFGTTGLSYISFLSVSLESNRALATVATAGSGQQDFINLSTPEQVATAVYALSKKKPVTYAKSCAYIFNLATNTLESICDASAWLQAR